MKYLKGYVKSSLKYIFIPTHIVVGIIGVVGAYYFSLFQMMSIEGSVLDVFVSSLYFIPFILALTFAAIPYVGVICEELENGYIYLCILRGDLRAYVISRVLGIEISAIITILIGSFIFILSVKYRLPWVDTNSVIYQTILEQGCFQEILKNNQYVTTYDQPYQGRNRRYYQITAQGRDKLVSIRQDWLIFQANVNTLLKEK